MAKLEPIGIYDPWQARKLTVSDLDKADMRLRQVEEKRKARLDRRKRQAESAKDE